MSTLVRHGVTASRQRQRQVLLFTTLLQNKRWLSPSSSWFTVGETQVQIRTRMDQIMFSTNCLSRHKNTSLVISCNNFHTSSHLADNRVRDKFETVSNINKEKISTTVQIQRVAVTSSNILPSIPSTTPPGSSQKIPLPDTSSSQLQNPTPAAPHTPPRPIKPKKVTKFFLFKFVEFVKKFPEKKFPGAMNVYRVFTIGVKEFAKELADYVRISGKVIMSSNGIRNLNSAELDIYYRMPKEVTRVAPTLIISALPFMNYIMFPIAYYFPKRLLSSHFWSLQQKSQFAIDLHQSKLFNYRPVFRSLQANIELIRDKSMKEKCRQVLDKLGSGSHPSPREIMEIKPLFESDPFSLQAIYGPHVKGLCRMHGIHTLYLSRRRLYDKAEMLHIMDDVMIRDGIFNLKTEDLKSACFLRGLNASNTSHEDMMEYLQQWSSISTSIFPHSYSLLLHLPILLAYNNPNNWALLVN